ncbi:MAG: NUDIX hydrolase [Alphaproteobacteria bacterium]|nr:NUDIX hydrolase [Alphaproteobacteria bacterium]MBV9419077.1 NUDIX hydrolase [Alphaproteobacteria bacterium]MBV9902971.1 NUDIX hydrolase [Alphaproteobacteria bacterium]
MRTNAATQRRATAKATAKTAPGAQSAALPFRIGEGGLEIMLITSRRTRRWIVPKGWVQDGMTPCTSAAREALEEAGISGDISDRPLGAFHYIKEKQGVGLPCRVALFPLKVTRQRRTWPEKDVREAKWFPATEAAALVAEPELRRLILKFAAQQAAHTP